jgi:hypothetical protein
MILQNLKRALSSHESNQPNKRALSSHEVNQPNKRALSSHQSNQPNKRALSSHESNQPNKRARIRPPHKFQKRQLHEEERDSPRDVKKPRILNQLPPLPLQIQPPSPVQQKYPVITIDPALDELLQSISISQPPLDYSGMNDSGMQLVLFSDAQGGRRVDTEGEGREDDAMDWD